MISVFLLLAVPLLVPSSARAQANASISISAADQQAILQCQHNLHTNLVSAAQAVGLNVNNTMSSIPRIDAALTHCLTGVMAAFSTNVAISSPSSIIWGIVNSVVINTLLGLLNQVCQIVMSDINQLKQAALSILNLACVPLPHIGLSGGGLNLPHIPCNGTNLLQGAVTVTNGTANQPGRWQLLGIH